MRTIVCVVALAMLAGGCKKKPVEEMPTEPVVEQPKPAQTVPEAVKEMAANFTRVKFEFDQASLDSGSMDALRANAAIMQQHPTIRVEIQGHADERGTTEYNLALGEKRAKAVQDAMSSMGVAASRLQIVTYGEEKPAVSGSNETAWSENRRAEFRVIGGDEGVTGTVP